MKPFSQEQIVLRRGEIEQELKRMLRKTGSKFTLNNIRDAIYGEQSQGAIAEIILMFYTDSGGVEFKDMVATVRDAWNYFPHRRLGGLSPAKKAIQHRRASDNRN
jgi:hypothetical protein